MKIPEKINVNVKVKPVLDPDFIPPVLWNKEFRKKVAQNGGEKITVILERPNGIVSAHPTEILKNDENNLNIKYVERLVKFLLWMKGGSKITIAGSKTLAEKNCRNLFTER